MPVLSRPQSVAPLVDSIKETTQVPHTILFLCSPGDTEQIEACRKVKAKVKIVPWEVGRSEYPKKMNLGYKLTKGEFMLMGADDLTFQECWDINALEVAEQSGAGVIGTNDCANRHVMRGYFSTHALVRRSYVQEMGASLDGPGTLVSESYDHNYCDRELSHLAQSRGLWAFAKEAKIKHRHPLWRTASDDSTYAKGRTSSREDQENFYLRSEQWQYVGMFPQEKEWINRAQRRIRRLEQRKKVRP